MPHAFDAAQEMRVGRRVESHEAEVIECCATPQASELRPAENRHGRCRLAVPLRRRAGAEASNTAAREGLAANLPDRAVGPPEVVAGDVAITAREAAREHLPFHTAEVSVPAAPPGPGALSAGARPAPTIAGHTNGACAPRPTSHAPTVFVNGGLAVVGGRPLTASRAPPQARDAPFRPPGRASAPGRPPRRRGGRAGDGSDL